MLSGVRVGRAGDVGFVWIEDARTHQLVDLLRPGEAVHDLAFSPDATKLAVASERAIWIWSLPSA